MADILDPYAKFYSKKVIDQELTQKILKKLSWLKYL